MEIFRLKGTRHVFAIQNGEVIFCRVGSALQFGSEGEYVVVAACRLFDEKCECDPEPCKVIWEVTPFGSIDFFQEIYRYQEVLDTGYFFMQKGMEKLFRVSSELELDGGFRITRSNRSAFTTMMEAKDIPLKFESNCENEVKFIPLDVHNGYKKVDGQNIVIDPNGNWVRINGKYLDHGSVLPPEVTSRVRRYIENAIHPNGWVIDRNILYKGGK